MLFYFLAMSFSAQTLLHLINSNSRIFIKEILVSYLKSHCQNQYHMNFLLCFLPKLYSFTILHLDLLSVLNFLFSLFSRRRCVCKCCHGFEGDFAVAAIFSLMLQVSTMIFQVCSFVLCSID